MGDHTYLLKRVQRKDVRKEIRRQIGNDPRMILIDSEPRTEPYRHNGYRGVTETFGVYLGETCLAPSPECIGVLTRNKTQRGTRDYRFISVTAFPNYR